MNLIRYQNRKLYSKDDSVYVTYPVLLRHIKNGGTIQVTCNKTHLDITDIVLRKCVEYNNNTSPSDIYQLLRK